MIFVVAIEQLLVFIALLLKLLPTYFPQYMSIESLLRVQGESQNVT